MATSVTTDVNLSAGSIVDASPGIAFDIEVAESLGSSTFSIPKRVRRRLEQTLENKSPASLEDIEAKLKDADYRRQQFHEWLVSKARTKRKLDQVSSPLSKDLAERLEARLSAAEQKRLELLAQEQTRLAKLHELRMAAKTEAQLRAEREREELGSKVESRVQQAETNRMAIVEAEKQRRAAANERMAQSIAQRTNMEDEHREKTEALRVAICQKSAAAEEKRAVLLQAEKNRAQAICMQARKVAEAVLREREVELNQKKEKLEARLLRAKSQRAEYLRQKGGCRGACHNHGHKLHKHGDRLCRKLTKCWRQFRGSMKTTYALAEEFSMAGISQSVASSLPFEHLAGRITSPAALKSAKAFLARIESRLMLSAATESTEIPKIDVLLRRLSPPQRKGAPAGVSRTGKRLPVKLPAKPKDVPKQDGNILERYPARVFLCAYMIFGHPEAVFSANGDREAALEEAAKKLLPEFEALVNIVMNRRSSISTPPPSPMIGDNSFNQGEHKPFAAQLISFDTAWHSYLCRFVAWKVKDAQLLEEDLIRVACQLEVSMLQKCKVVPGEASALTHDTDAIRKQVAEDQRLLGERIVHLTGKTGLEKMEEALLAVRSKFMEAKENGVSLPSPFAYSSPEDLKTVPEAGESSERPKSKVARSLFTSSPEVINMDSAADLQNPGVTNERMLNDMMHDGSWKMLKHGNLTGSLAKIEEQIRATMEKAFWDRVEESLLSERPEYAHVVSFVGEIRDGLEAIVPAAWKQGLRESLDLELLSQVLESGSNDFAYLRGLLDYTLDLIRKLGAPARDEQAKSAHQALIEDLSKASPTKESFGKAVVKGIRFVFERLQELKQDINVALTQTISGSAGIDYLQNAFAERYNLKPETPKEAVLEKLPRTVKWFQAIVSTTEAQKAEVDAAMRTLKPVQLPDSQAKIPPAFPMCTGGRVLVSGNLAKQKAAVTGVEDSRMESIRWGSTESVVRLGLLEIISGSEPATEEALPETLALNASRLVDGQNDFQRTVVMATGLLLLRQELMAKVPAPQLEEIVKEAYKDLSLLLNEPLATVTRIGSLLAGVGAKHCSQHYPDEKACGEFMTRVLDRSLSAGDPVFGRVTATVRSSLRALLLVGNGADGVSLAECSLKRIGGGLLVEDVLKLAKKVDKTSNITVQVHGLWYSRML